MIWICDECKKDKHKKCRDRIICDCSCNINGTADKIQKAAAIVGGAGLAVGGLALTICTGGIGAVLIGGAMLGAGVSSTFHGAEKAIKKQRIDGTMFVADVAFGAVTGVATGGMGAIGETVATNVVKQGVKEVAKVGAKKLAVRAATGVVTGVATKAIDEVKQCSTTDKKWSDYGKSFDKNGNKNGTAAAWVTGALVGGLGGASTHISSNLTKEVSNGVAKSVARIAVSGTTAALSDATVQGATIITGNQDHYDVKRTIKSATASTIMATAQEGTKNAIYNINGGKNNMLIHKPNKEAMENIPEQGRQEAIKESDKLNKLPQNLLNDGRTTAKIRTDLNDVHETQKTIIQNYDVQIEEVRILKQDAQKVGNINQIKEYSSKYQQLKSDRKIAGQDLTRIEQKIGQNPPYYMDDQSHAHFLDKKKFGQVSVDINKPNPTERGQNRVIFDRGVDSKGQDVFLYSDHTFAHDYETTRGFGKGDCYKNYTTHTNIIKATNEVTNIFMCNDASKIKEEQEF
ncbi:unnamed protein product [Adineta steineri]|uniref:Uncharacterized protein n=1 Tax=Adineta steineri TaxID=433720 RepID=A0A814GU21_9BILA|nr:unnamed protein product [Adineta steineri]CAF1001114.1 unnamed protein product [Adineta steineri]